LREAQAAALALPNTGMAVTIDVGEADNLHPHNKFAVGNRLGMAALKITYGVDSLHTSPLYKNMHVEGDHIIVEFTGNIIDKKNNYIHGFAIAGADTVFHWAKAYLKNDSTVVVYNSDVKSPVAVRYLWSGNPGEVDLYNKQNLPVAPFRTDNYKGITAGKKFSYTE
jgi:sialate O-acetylesterase